jgi:hypothetical protein
MTGHAQAISRPGCLGNHNDTQVDPFVERPVGLLVRDFGARSPAPIAVVEAASTAASFEFV